MKKWKWITAILFCFALALGFTACGESANQPLTFQTLVFEDNRAQLTVSNATETFSFADEIKATGKTQFAVSSDEFGQNTFLTKVVPLAEGDNVFYVFEMNDNEITQRYAITIRRRPVYEVSFEGLKKPKRVEEGSLAKIPREIPTKPFYTFDSWNFDFTQPITQSTTISATWNLAKEEVFIIEGTTLIGVTEPAKHYFPFPAESFEALKGITAIGANAFRGCACLYDVTLPNSITSIGNNAFYGCTNLTNVTLPDSITTIEKDMFKFCYSLASITLPDSLISIGDSAFENCQSLTELSIPDSVTSIGTNAFYFCCSLLNITIPDSITSISDSAFHSCDSLTSVVIGDSVTSIGSYAFYHCDNLASVVIGDGVTSIGSHAFELCYKLVEVINKSTHITVTKGNSNGYVGYYALAVYNSGDAFTSKLINDNGYIIYSDGSEKVLVGYSGMETDLVLPSYITKIYQRAFYNCDSLTSITIPDSATSIGSSAFYDCDSLTSVVIGDSITSIGEDAFKTCTSLTSITIPDSVTVLDAGAFQGCYNLTNITIGNGTMIIGAYAFCECRALTSITIPDSVSLIGSYAFGTCINLIRVVIGNGVTTIDASAFFGCTRLTSITIPDSVTSIRRYAFFDCANLISVVIGNGVTTIDADAFVNCTDLTSVYYHGTESEWEHITIDSDNDKLTSATLHFYSESEPALNGDGTAYEGKFWRYVDGVPTPWVL